MGPIGFDVDADDRVREAFDARRGDDVREGRSAAGDKEGGHDEQQQRTRRETKALGIAKDKAEPGRHDDNGDDAPAPPGESGHPTGTPATTCSIA
jgi:hypothetical protein